MSPNGFSGQALTPEQLFKKFQGCRPVHYLVWHLWLVAPLCFASYFTKLSRGLFCLLYYNCTCKQIGTNFTVYVHFSVCWFLRSSKHVTSDGSFNLCPSFWNETLGMQAGTIVRAASHIWTQANCQLLAKLLEVFAMRSAGSRTYFAVSFLPEIQNTEEGPTSSYISPDS